MKKARIYLLVTYFILQLSVPGYLLFRHYDTLHTGESYKFEVAPYDPYDPFRGRYVALQTEISLYSFDGPYAILRKDSNGYAIISKWQEQRPESEPYIKDPQLSRYYMNETMAPQAEQLQRTLDPATNTIYLLVKVKNGNYVIQGLYVNDIPIEQYLITP